MDRGTDGTAVLRNEVVPLRLGHIGDHWHLLASFLTACCLDLFRCASLCQGDRARCTPDCSGRVDKNALTLGHQ